VKLLRTIRLDPSDTFIFERAAEPGEWAVSGAFVFSDDDPEQLEGKARSAFRGGFLGVQTLGWSTLVQIVEAGDDDRLPRSICWQSHLREICAPSIAEAVAAAEENLLAESLCNHPKTRLLRAPRARGGEIAKLSALRPRTGRGHCAPLHFSMWKARRSRRKMSISRGWRSAAKTINKISRNRLASA
jgi:hypothetical protein